jgi:hypothetical protein
MLSAGVDDNSRPEDADAVAHLSIDVCDAQPKIRSTLRLDEGVHGAARVLARQVGLYTISAMSY